MKPWKGFTPVVKYEKTGGGKKSFIDFYWGYKGMKKIKAGKRSTGL
jgi:hypothetical protein